MGTIRRRESGKFEAFYRMEGRTIRAPRRFDDDAEAQAWLATERAAHVTGTWIDPDRVSVAPASAPGVLTLSSTFEALCEALMAEEAASAEARPAYSTRESLRHGEKACHVRVHREGLIGGQGGSISKGGR